jgi:trehalose 6-phosphate phosphatase
MRAPELTISRETIDAVIFNLDGVVTRITKLHINAWRHVFNAYLRDCSTRDGEDYRPFDVAHDYYRYVDGRPRYQAVKHFLRSRQIDLPMGEPDDPSSRETVCGIGNRKNLIFDWFMKESGVEVYGCAVALVHQLRRVGNKTAVVSASKHCDLILERAKITDQFDARVDGADAERLDLDSKPDPEIFLEAAHRLGVPPARTAVFEDTVVGITAGKRGRFTLVVGVDRGGQAEKMREHGADFVLRDLCRVDVEGTDTGEGLFPPRPLIDMSLVSKQLAGRRPALFLDYGGTLAPIEDRPEDARLSDDMRLVLRDAAGLMTVVVVSGRDLEKLSGLVGLPEVIYAGSHGMEIRGPDLRLELPEGGDALDDLNKASEELAKALESLPEARLERTRFAVVVHHRSQPDGDPRRVEAAIRRVRVRFPQLHLTGGKEVMELLPDIDWDKGRAVRWLLSELGLDGPDVLPIYIGDDVTDEDAFRAVRGSGLGILVSDRPQPSAATYWVKDAEQVAVLLRHLVESS